MYSVKVYGAGSIGNHLAHACRSKNWDVTVCDIDPDALARMKNDIYPSRYGAWDRSIKLTTPEQLEGHHFDLVIIGTPPTSHMSIAIKELENNTPQAIMIEKPLATPDLKDCQKLYDLSVEKNVFVACAFNHNLAQNTITAERLISDGHLGIPKSMHVRWLEHWGGIFGAHPWLAGPQDSYLGFSSSGGGASGEHSHAISIWQHFSRFMGLGRISEVIATMSVVDNGEVSYDEINQVLVKSEKGMHGTIIQDVITSPPIKSFRIQGEENYMEWFVNYSKSCDALKYDTDTKLFEKTRPDDFKGEIDHIELIMDGKVFEKDSPISLERGLDVMLIIAACHLSHKEGKKVMIDYDHGYNLGALKC